MNSIPKTKRYIEMDIKEKIANDCGGTQLIDDVNHPVRRYFRCWLDGSYEYDGGITYRRNCDFILKHHDDHRIMRQFVVNQLLLTQHTNTIVRLDTRENVSLLALRNQILSISMSCLSKTHSTLLT